MKRDLACLVIDPHSLPYGDDGGDEQGECNLEPCDLFAKQQCGRAQRYESLQQLQLTHLGDAAKGEPLIPGEEADELTEQRQIQESRPGRSTNNSFLEKFGFFCSI